MNYIQIYFSIIEKAKARVLDGYHEKHHIVPVSLFSDTNSAILNRWQITEQEDSSNIVCLTAREHYICHLLLVRIFENISTNCYEKMLFAANFMANRTKSSREYDWLRKQFSEHMVKMLTGKPSRAKGKKWTEEQKRNKSETSPARGKTYEEIYGEEKAAQLKLMRKQSRTGRVNSPELRERLSKRVITDSWRQKISESNTGKKRTEEVKKKLKDFFGNPDKNPVVNQTLYKFYHDDGRTFVARRHDMRKLFGCTDIHKLIRGERKRCRGWSYKGEIVKTA